MKGMLEITPEEASWIIGKFPASRHPDCHCIACFLEQDMIAKLKPIADRDDNRKAV